MSRPFRFAVNMLTPGTGAEWRAKCREAEALGYDVILVPDHLGMPAPFPSLVAAAEVTERPRVGTFVLNAGFWNPSLLAREVASTDQLTGGRLELGLGAGYVKAEHDSAGLPFGSPRERVDHLERTVTELERLLGDPGHVPAAAQSPRPPLLLGGNGDRMLRLAARHADVAAFTGGASDRDGTLRLISPTALEERVALYRSFEDGRAEPAELNCLVQIVAVGGDPRARIRELMGYTEDLGEDEFLDHPALLTGSVKEIAERVRGHRERYGFTYFTVLEPFMEEFAPVIEELRG
ncbi:LLM class F420-dependent oxidoreductase [Streptomyces griseocarneus]|uniref:LLM class F420-dependent oxidoreductase n=1 Tax=Streptomyces griseocarneus TaxID=51201 RepID=UPI00167C56AD|nr:LLM class F420-dependent oxidoreductase [Streptomyces griseocarneus]MBZ6477457.1 LLM class F420-dependent oxidoreductase [Streptomyces griseocarneus]GHG49512.1 LLM class F420-dependent oxidoreductase [Streptomyces griseocarneus]